MFLGGEETWSGSEGTRKQELDPLWSSARALCSRLSPAAGGGPARTSEGGNLRRFGPGGALTGRAAAGQRDRRAPCPPPWWSTAAGRRATAAATAPRSGGRSPPVSGKEVVVGGGCPGSRGGSRGPGKRGRPQ